MKHLTFTFVMFLLAAAFCPTAEAQAVTEYGLGAGRAATTTAPARNVANGISGVFDSLNKAAGYEKDDPATRPAPSSPAKPNRAAHNTRRPVRSKRSPATPSTEETASVTPASPVLVHEDPRQIQAGIDYDEMLRRFGPPSMSVTTGPGSGTVWYSSQGTTYQIEMHDGKVVAAPGTKAE